MIGDIDRDLPGFEVRISHEVVPNKDILVAVATESEEDFVEYGVVLGKYLRNAQKAVHLGLVVFYEVDPVSAIAVCSCRAHR